MHLEFGSLEGAQGVNLKFLQIKISLNLSIMTTKFLAECEFGCPSTIPQGDDFENTGWVFLLLNTGR